jgi:hypothetical protein
MKRSPTKVAHEARPCCTIRPAGRVISPARLKASRLGNQDSADGVSRRLVDCGRGKLSFYGRRRLLEENHGPVYNTVMGTRFLKLSRKFQTGIPSRACLPSRKFRSGSAARCKCTDETGHLGLL